MWAELLLAGERNDDASSKGQTDAPISTLCASARHKFTVEERDRLATALRDIRGKTQGLGPGTNAYCIFQGDRGYIQFMADVGGEEFLCEIQSHHYYTPVELMLTDKLVSLIMGSGFHWPRDLQNFSRWFRVSTEADVDTPAESSLWILHGVFGHDPGKTLKLTVHVP
jgi:hypothetical protein